MKNIIAIFGFIFVLLSMATPASARPVDCLLEIDGKTYIKGVCEFTPSDGGDFQIMGSNGYFAQLSIYDKEKDKNLAGLNWNASPDSTHAQAFVGDVRRNGACWESETAKICARGLSAAKLAKLKTSRPEGVMIELQVAGYPMVCFAGYSFKPGTQLVLGKCRGPNGELPKLFQPGIDNILIDKHPDLCIDAKPTKDANVSKLVLADCKTVANKWHLFQGVIHSSSKDLCWSLPGINDPNTPWPINVMASPCPEPTEGMLRFDFYKGG